MIHIFSLFFLLLYKKLFVIKYQKLTLSLCAHLLKCFPDINFLPPPLYFSSTQNYIYLYVFRRGICYTQNVFRPVKNFFPRSESDLNFCTHVAGVCYPFCARISNQKNKKKTFFRALFATSSVFRKCENFCHGRVLSIAYRKEG